MNGSTPSLRNKEDLKHLGSFWVGLSGNVFRLTAFMVTSWGSSPDEPTVNDGLHLIRKLELCEHDAAKLILLKHFVAAALEAERERLEAVIERERTERK